MNTPQDGNQVPLLIRILGFLSCVILIPSALIGFFVSLFLNDAGTSPIFQIVGETMAVLFPILSVVCIVLAQRKRSILLALLGLVCSFAFYIFLYLATLVIDGVSP